MTREAKRFLSIGECMLEFAKDAAGGWRLGFAGDTLNTAWYFRAAAPESGWEVDYFTRLGTDPYSDQIVAFLMANGIGTALISRDSDRQPGLYLIDTRDGERSFTYWRDQSAARRLADDEGALAAAVLAADAVYVSGITLAILAPDRRRVLVDVMRAARDAGRLVAFDPNLRPRLWEDAGTMRAAITEAAATATLVLPSFEDEAAAFGDASPEVCARRYLAAGAGEVVVKNGGGEMWVAAGGRVTALGELPRVAPIDTTGAGDAFNGAYLAARLSGRPPATAARAGHALASRVVRHRGALMPVD